MQSFYDLQYGIWSSGDGEDDTLHHFKTTPISSSEIGSVSNSDMGGSGDGIQDGFSKFFERSNTWLRRIDVLHPEGTEE